MADQTDRAPSFAQLLDLAEQLQLDEPRADAELRRRDRDSGRRTGGGRRERVLAWLAEVREGRDLYAATAIRSRRLILAALVLLGWCLGFAAARIVYYYDGARPVNTIEVLGVFVAAPLGLLVLTAIAMLPAAVRRRLPVVGALQDGLAVLSPGRWQSALSRLLPQPQREAFGSALGRGRIHQRLFGDVQRWAVLLASQSFGVAFHVGALSGCLYLVLFTDLAFGWSTTLDIQSGELHRITQALSIPWAAWFSEAVPSISLIDATRYFRLGGGSLPGTTRLDSIDPASLGGWWSFCVAAMATYGLLPRLSTWALARYRFAAAVGFAFDRLPGLADLLDRLDNPLVETISPDAERTGPPGTSSSVVPGREVATRRCAIVNWAGLDLADESLSSAIERGFGLRAICVRGAGGTHSLAEDRALLRSLAEMHQQADLAVVVGVRSWEPPVLEFVDFVSELRAELGDGAAIIVVPIALGTAGGPAAALETDHEQWRRRIDSVGDPWLSTRVLDAHGS
ncbi:MAG: DUF2868 domain-containing protein [Myxococcota bacterium]